ncbi:MAG: lysine 5,6-aminomutase subunit alpha [Candidatus Limnocylindrales bacterium]
MQPIGEPEHLAALNARAGTLAAAWGAVAAGSTSVGQERAILRLFGVAGVDRSGRPLAAEVIDRYLAPDPRRLGGGISLPFAMAMAEYDLPAHELAREVAAGHVDLGLEAELLAEPDRRAIAMADATRLSLAALDRIDANRTARRELLAVLGDPATPWVGAALVAPAIVDALDEARVAIEAGAQLVRVDVPPSRELAERMLRIGEPVQPWHASASSRGGLDTFDPSGSPIPTGSQRALAVLRRFVDEAGARRRGYVRLATDAPALAAPDQAVVAAFERIDVVIADPMREIVTGRVDPDRAIADHVFAHRILCRAGTKVLVPAGPLLVTSDIAAGVPSDTATRSGRALALQLLAVGLARRDGMPAESVIVGALPEWLADEPDFPARAAAEIALRRALLPGHPLAFVEPSMDDEVCARWQAVVGALLPDAGEVEMVLRRSHGTAQQTRGMTHVAASLRGSRVTPELTGVAAAHARDAVAAAMATLAALEEQGWRALVDQPLGIRANLGGDSVAERTEAFDPLSIEAAARA